MATRGVSQKRNNIAVTAHSQPLLAFNQNGLIDVFLFDDTSSIVDKLGLDKSKQIPLPTLACANILFQVSQQLQLLPGETVEIDKQILAHLKNCISDDVANKDMVIEEICAAWNFVASLPMSTYYAKMKESKAPATLAYQGAYELSLHNYIAGYLATLTRFNQVDTWVFTQAAELVKSTLEGRAFSNNPFIKMLALTALADECTSDLQESRDTIHNINTRLEKEKSKWFTDIIGLVGFEIEQALEELKEEEDVKEKSGELQKTLQCLLDEKCDDLSIDPTICGLFEETFKLARAPLESDIVKRSNPQPTQAQVLQAIAYVVAKNLREKRMTLAANSSTDVDVLKLAASSLEANTQTLLGMLLDEDRYFTPRILTAIAARASSEAVRDVANAKLSVSKSDGPLLPAATITKLYDAKKQKAEKGISNPRAPVAAHAVIEDEEEGSEADNKPSKGRKRKTNT